MITDLSKICYSLGTANQLRLLSMTYNNNKYFIINNNKEIPLYLDINNINIKYNIRYE